MQKQVVEMQYKMFDMFMANSVEKNCLTYRKNFTMISSKINNQINEYSNIPDKIHPSWQFFCPNKCISDTRHTN